MRGKGMFIWDQRFQFEGLQFGIEDCNKYCLTCRVKARGFYEGERQLYELRKPI